MHILVLEPFLGGSHRAFVDGWRAHSRHTFTVLGYAPHKWKWRMRHSSHTLAAEVSGLIAQEGGWDIVLCSDMLNLPEFLGFSPGCMGLLPKITYFHENQLTYPVREERERDIHFGYTNYLTALAADAVWFNSNFHRQSFLTAVRDLLSRMPDNTEPRSVDLIEKKSSIMPQGIGDIIPNSTQSTAVPRLLWCARWEHDKGPDLFFEALYRLEDEGIQFELLVLGEQFEEIPAVFHKAHSRLGSHVMQWGYVESRDAYTEALQSADIFVSTANHEFFGISTVEAVAAGCFPLLPARLAYPEIFGLPEHPGAVDFFYDGSLGHLTHRLRELLNRASTGNLWIEDQRSYLRERIDRYRWPRLVNQFDRAIDELTQGDN